ncbi:MAG TPA: lytic murein transglycosylase, partial [Solirubrobacteraceae bacterium]|nr:lytic murein transglycosylase [Solirubrobacteraceae bacterium]
MSAGTLAAPRERIGSATRIAVAAAALLVVALLLAVAALTGASLEGADEQAPGGVSAEPSALASQEIPAAYLGLYERAAARYGLDWAILAGIGKVECDHGRDADPACSREGATNSAGAGGPMQFIAQTWAQYGVDGDDDGRIDRWDAADAIYAAANYLRRSGAPGNYRSAIFAYNHADWYVTEVERWAARYRGSTLSDASGASLIGGQAQGGEVAGADERLAALTATPVQFIAGARATLSPSDGHQALIPVGVP